MSEIDIFRHLEGASASEPPRRGIRRIVTGHDSAGKAVVWLDGIATNAKVSDPHVTSTLIWSTDTTPAQLNGIQDEGARILGTPPPANGSRFAVIELQPGNARRPLHRTDTVDYVICISGTVDMELDDSTVTMHVGDVMVQRGTRHNWINRSGDVAVIAFVLLDAMPKREGSVEPMKSVEWKDKQEN